MGTRAQVRPPADIYVFNGMDGNDLDGRRVKVHSISLAGRVNFTIQFVGEDVRGLHDAALTDALAMIGHGIWRHVDPATDGPTGEPATVN